MNKFMRQTGTVLKLTFARARFVAVFVVAALVVGYWDDIKNHVDKWTRPATAPDALAGTAAGEIEYYCPMHPNVVRGEPGLCPRCGMPLVKRKRGEAVKLPADVLARVQLTPQRVSLAGVGTSGVEYRKLVREVKAVGVLDYDETRLARLSARVAGRADELFVTYTGQAIKAGDPVYSLYSPEVYTAQRDYLLARKRVNQLPMGTGEEAKADATAVYNASLQKLALWGMTTEQLDRLDHEFDEKGKVPTNLTVTSPISGIVVKKDVYPGQYVQAGEAPYTVADLSRLWLQVKLYERDVPLVNVGDAVDVVVEGFPNEPVEGVVAFKAFQVNPETRTLDARVAVENAGLKLRPGMFAGATVRVPVVNTATTRAAGPGTRAVPAARAYAAALAAYVKAQDLLAHDKVEGVEGALEQAVKELEGAKQSPQVADGFGRLEAAVGAAKGKGIKEVRESFKEISAAMIEMGKAIGIPSGAPRVQVFRCPMKKANWLQEGSETANPYYGAEMFNCGSAVEALPAAPPAPVETPATRAAAAGRVLSVPRSAVIDTGTRKIVYVESSPGVFDMRAVEVGPMAADGGGEFYPVLRGLEEGERVVTAGAFLIDAENRLNPAR